MAKCESIGCDNEGYVRIDGFLLCYECYCEYKTLNEMEVGK